MCVYILPLIRHGATVEEMTVEVNKAQSALDTVMKDLRNMSALNKVTLRYQKLF